MPSGYILTNSYFSLTYYYSDKENKYRIPYQNKYNMTTPMMRGHRLLGGNYYDNDKLL